MHGGMLLDWLENENDRLKLECAWLFKMKTMHFKSVR